MKQVDKLLKQRFGKVVTFYSYKGGVGRSMALANIGMLLAQWGYKVLMIDWDLEAPGLENYFKEELLNVKEVKKRKGLIDLLGLRADSEQDIDSEEWKASFKKVALGDYTTDITVEGEGQLTLLAAGKRDENYGQKVRKFDYSSFFVDKDGSRFIEDLREQWQKAYDFILIDSRTGFTDSSRICTVHLPDILLLMFTPNEQSFNGILEVAENARNEQPAILYDRFPFRTLPIPCRIENGESTLLDIWMKRIVKDCVNLLQWLPKDEKEDSFLLEPAQLFNQIKIPYKTLYSYDEKLAVSGRDNSDPTDLGFVYETLAAIIANDLQNMTLLKDSRDSLIKKAKGQFVEDYTALHENQKLLEKQIIDTTIAAEGKSRELHAQKQRTRLIAYGSTFLTVLSILISFWFYLKKDKPLETSAGKLKYDLFVQSFKDTSSAFKKNSAFNVLSQYRNYFDLDDSSKVRVLKYKLLLDTSMKLILKDKIKYFYKAMQGGNIGGLTGMFNDHYQLNDRENLKSDEWMSNTDITDYLKKHAKFVSDTSLTVFDGFQADSNRFVLVFTNRGRVKDTIVSEPRIEFSFNYDLKIIKLIQQSPKLWNLKGYEALINKDVEHAIFAFDYTDFCYPEYNTAYDISRILKKDRQALRDPNSSLWPGVSKHILDSCSWKMPLRILQQLKRMESAGNGSIKR